MPVRCLLGPAALTLVTAGCHAPADPEIQAGLTPGGLGPGEETVAQHIAIREVRRQHVDLASAVVLAYSKHSRHSAPRFGSCGPGRLIRLVLEGSFPSQCSTVKAEDIYIGSVSERICASTYLDAVPVLRSGIGTLYVPGTASTGE